MRKPTPILVLTYLLLVAWGGLLAAACVVMVIAGAAVYAAIIGVVAITAYGVLARNLVGEAIAVDVAGDGLAWRTFYGTRRAMPWSDIVRIDDFEPPESAERQIRLVARDGGRVSVSERLSHFDEFRETVLRNTLHADRRSRLSRRERWFGH